MRPTHSPGTHNRPRAYCRRVFAMGLTCTPGKANRAAPAPWAFRTSRPDLPGRRADGLVKVTRSGEYRRGRPRDHRGARWRGSPGEGEWRHRSVGSDVRKPTVPGFRPLVTVQ